MSRMKIDKRTTKGMSILKDVEFNTYLATTRVEKKLKEASALILDPDERHRVQQLYCKSCYYRDGGLVGQGFTSYTCKICSKKESWHNTGTPTLCRECAADNKLCVACMGELEYDTIADQRRWT